MAVSILHNALTMSSLHCSWPAIDKCGKDRQARATSRDKLITVGRKWVSVELVQKFTLWLELAMARLGLVWPYDSEFAVQW